uniref:Uncharacterized protein n=1 Tax=Sinocyclocheilus anshuiensis TaxID=1608454 RepID=A0A671M882_9TELE
VLYLMETDLLASITKFGSAADIPARFIERNISIRGRLRNITEKGLEVEHIPIYVPLLSRHSLTLLDVRLAEVELTGSLFNTCVNEELLRHGLARTSPFVGLDSHSRVYWRLYKRFLRAESRAEKKGKGLWKEASRWERAANVLRNNLLFISVKKLFKWTSGAKEKSHSGLLSQNYTWWVHFLKNNKQITTPREYVVSDLLDSKKRLTSKGPPSGLLNSESAGPLVGVLFSPQFSMVRVHLL